MQNEPRTEMDKKTHGIRCGDLVISPLMVVGGLWFAYDSYRMSHAAIVAGKATIETAPGLMPFVVSTLIVLCSVYVFVNALRSGADLGFLQWARLKPALTNREKLTAPIVMGLFAAYVFLLIGNLPFLVATVIFGIAMMGIFKATQWRWIIVINVVYAAVVVYCFTEFAFTKFPFSWPF